MPEAREPGAGGGNGTRATFAGVTVLDGATYRLPDGAAVRAFVHPLERVSVPAVSVTLHTPEEWAMEDLPHHTVDGTGRIMRQSWSAPARPTAWTAADLGSGDAAAWDAAVRRLGGEPWLLVDRLPTDTTPQRSAPRPRRGGTSGAAADMRKRS